MGVYGTITLNRRLIQAGVVVGYLLAAGMVVTRIVNTENTPGEVLGSIALGVAAAVPPTMAFLSLDRRPGLLPAASLASLLMALVDLSLLLFWLPLALAWGWAHNRRPVRAEVSRPQWWARVAMAFGVVLSVFVLFVHLDPYCTETMEDGTVVEVDPAGKGLQSGWRFGSTTSHGSFTGQLGNDGPVSSQCTSDTVVWGEAVGSLLINLVVIGAAFRWPIGYAAGMPTPARIAST